MMVLAEAMATLGEHFSHRVPEFYLRRQRGHYCSLVCPCGGPWMQFRPGDVKVCDCGREFFWTGITMKTSKGWEAPSPEGVS